MIRSSFSRQTLPLVIGAVMILLGAFIALRPLWAGPVPLANSRWVDVAFAVFFLLRGTMSVRAALRAREAMRSATRAGPRASDE